MSHKAASQEARREPAEEPTWSFELDPQQGLTLFHCGRVFSTFHSRMPGASPSAVKLARYVFDLGAGLFDDPGLEFEDGLEFMRMVSKLMARLHGV